MVGSRAGFMPNQAKQQKINIEHHRNENKKVARMGGEELIDFHGILGVEK